MRSLIIFGQRRKKKYLVKNGLTVGKATAFGGFFTRKDGKADKEGGESQW